MIGSENKIGKYKVDENQENQLPFKWNNTEYKNNPVVNCIVGVLYLDLMRNNIDKNYYIMISTLKIKRISFYAHNKVNLLKIYSLMDPQPTNFDIGATIMDKMVDNEVLSC